MQVKFIKSIREVAQHQWARLSRADSPFLSYEFLSSLEEHECVGEKLGWLPYHLVAENDGQLQAFMPLYIKDNSYGELVFDWSWAEAYQKHGLPYYPKLVSAIPYTPVTGDRVFVAEGVDKSLLYKNIADGLKETIQVNQLSSMHCLFPTEEEMEAFVEQGYSRRLGCQFHWRNQGYESFDHYLTHFVSRKRKNIKKERKSVVEQGFQFQMLTGDVIEPDLWPIIYELYQITFYKKSGIPTFSQSFFEAMGRLLGKQFLVNLVSLQGRYVACAIFYRDQKSLYGRHWGCFEEYSGLHFEACYYQGLEFAIANGLETFEPGAQGEHKVSRGFLPTETWSVHWIDNPLFKVATNDFCKREEQYMRQYIEEMSTSSPFKS